MLISIFICMKEKQLFDIITGMLLTICHLIHPWLIFSRATVVIFLTSLYNSKWWFFPPFFPFLHSFMTNVSEFCARSLSVYSFTVFFIHPSNTAEMLHTPNQKQKKRKQLTVKQAILKFNLAVAIVIGLNSWNTSKLLHIKAQMKTEDLQFKLLNCLLWHSLDCKKEASALIPQIHFKYEN